MRLLIKNGIVIDPSQNLNGKYDILIDEGKIRDIRTTSLDRDCISIDAEGMYVVPGLIDVHVHLRDPGYEHKETIMTGAESAAAGGFATIVCMPNTQPVIDHPDTVRYIQNRAKLADVNIYMLGSVTKNLEGEVLSDYAILKELGIVGITDDGMTLNNAKVMYEALERAREYKLLTCLHCEDKELVYDNSIHQGDVAKQLGLLGRPAVSEDIIVARDIVLAESLDAKIHIQHVSSGNSVKLIRRAKERGVKVSCEATPHHLLGTDHWVRSQGTNAKMSPPLRSDKDKKEIIEGLKDGTIDIIATDHAPHTEEDKGQDILKAANGIVGLETALGVIMTHFVHSGIIDMRRLVMLMSLKPSELFELDKGTLKVGKDADVTIIDPNKKWTVDKNQFKSKGKNTPFHGMELTGKAVMTIVNGKVVYDEITR